MGSDPQFTVRSTSQNGVASIALQGDLDIATLPELEAHLAPFQDDGVAAIMLDMRELTFIDTTGLHAIDRASQRAKGSGQQMILVGTRPSARRLFEITGIDHLLDDRDSMLVLKRFIGKQVSEPDARAASGER